ncbi:MAG: Fic family protein [Rhizobiales bacterium]|nr:Fic family protein [Hyphomicrobiales bacterium]
MAFEGYDAFDDPYLYKNTPVLKNRLGIRDPGTLEAFEVEMSSLRADEPLPSGRFDAVHYRKIHRHLFQDVYRWAGRHRTVRITKGGNPFCFPEHIDWQMKQLFARLAHGELLRTQAFEAFAARAAEFLSELNAIHPFREGNGRTQLAFLDHVAAYADHPLRLDQVKRGTFLPAMIASFAGDLGPLTVELTKLQA